MEGDSVELRIDALAAGGAGVGRDADGCVVFVPDTAPGDRVRARILKRHRRHAWARLESIEKAGPSRVAPPCPVFGRCGGCSWQHVDYPAQLEAKAGILESALRRIGGLRDLPAPTLVASPSPYGTRRRARVLVRDGDVGFRRRRSHEPCPTAQCPVLVPALDATLARLADRRPPDGEWELLAGDDDELRCLPLGEPGAPLHLRVGPDRLQVSPGVFVQSSAPLLPVLVGAVHEAAGRGAAALELHAGAGFFTLGLARRFERVWAVEAQPEAVRDLRANCAAAGLANVEVRQARVEDALRGGHLPGEPDAAILDPPRSGLARGAAAALAGLRPGRIVLLSCDPATLARDLAAFAAAGYPPRRVQGFDLFPQTPHLEALAVLEP